MPNERIPFEPEICPECGGELLEGGSRMVWYDDFGRSEPSIRHCECGYEEEI